MRRFILSILFTATASLCFAQLAGSGYYRVKNNKSQRYIYIIDNTSSGINVESTTVDMGAVQLWKDNSLLTNPASVIYAEQVGSKWNLNAQGTGVYQLVGQYVDVTGNIEKNALQVSASMKGMTFYLYDGAEGESNHSSLVTSSGVGHSQALRVWNALPMNETDNYIAVDPQIAFGNKFYAPYYVSFPFSFKSSGLKAYYIKKVDTEHRIAVLSEITGVVPSETPVFIECNSQTITDNILHLENYNSYKTRPADNRLQGNYFAYSKRTNAYRQYDGTTMRVLGITSEGKLGFVTATKDMLEDCSSSSKELFCLKANSSYLTVPAGSASEFTIMTQEEYEAYIKQAAVTNVGLDDEEPLEIYSIDGTRLPALQNGINIVKFQNGEVRKILR